MLKDNTYITITRQYGSGGKEVANIVAKKLGINCYDRKIVHLVVLKDSIIPQNLYQMKLWKT